MRAVGGLTQLPVRMASRGWSALSPASICSTMSPGRPGPPTDLRLQTGGKGKLAGEDLGQRLQLRLRGGDAHSGPSRILPCPKSSDLGQGMRFRFGYFCDG